MRRALIAAAFALSAAALFAAPAFAASPIEGLWNTPEHNGQVQIFACGSAFCGKVVNSDRFATQPDVTDEKNKDAALRGRKLKGLQILSGFTGGPTEWTGGSVYNPEDGGTYHGSIKLDGADSLKLTGCIIVPLCKTQTWRRAK